MDALTICEVAADDPRLVPLIEAHLAHSARFSPDTSCHTMSAAKLTATPGLRMWLATGGDTPAGCAALKPLASGAEVKSVHVLKAARGRGLARALMEHVIAAAREAGHAALMLETGSDKLEGYGAARTLYERLGFSYRGPFEGYAADPASAYMTLPLGARDASR
ncbi:MAG: GNAT family N-acetyltransferase [Pseudomonadota bacterium]